MALAVQIIMKHWVIIIFDSINDGKTVIFDDELSYLRYSPYLDRDNCVLDSSFKSIDKSKENNTVFVKIHFDELEKTGYQYKDF